MFQMRKKKVQRLKCQKLITITTCVFIEYYSKIQALVEKKKKLNKLFFFFLFPAFKNVCRLQKTQPKETMQRKLCGFCGEKKSPMLTKLGYFLCLKLANWSEPMTFAIVIQKKSQELDFWNYSLVHNKHKCPNYIQPSHTTTHKHLCSREGVQIYLKTIDSYVYYCQGAASSKTLLVQWYRMSSQTTFRLKLDTR